MDNATSNGYNNAPLIPAGSTVDGAPLADTCDTCLRRTRGAVRALGYTCGGVHAVRCRACWNLVYA